MSTASTLFSLLTVDSCESRSYFVTVPSSCVITALVVCAEPTVATYHFWSASLFTSTVEVAFATKPSLFLVASTLNS